MHLLLFDWNLGGHHARYLRHLALAACPFAEVTIAAPDSMLDELSDLPVHCFPLGEGRPSVQVNQSQARQNALLAAEELSLMEGAASKVKADHIVNLYGDPVIRWFVQRKRLFPCPVTFCMFFVRDHYPDRFGARLSTRELLRAQFLRWNLRRFRARADAHSLLFLDREAVDVYQGREGVPVYWFPEPPVAPLQVEAGPRSTKRVTIYGALAPRKGIDWVASAVSQHAPSTLLTLAGPVDPQFTSEFDQHVSRMQAAGAKVDLRLSRHKEQSSLRLLAESAAALLAYPAHYGMSRVLLESCSVGTPVIAHNFGLLGHLVRKHRLGVVVDCNNPQLLGEALNAVAAEPDWAERLHKNLMKFNNCYTPSVFRSAIRNAFFAGQVASRSLVASA